MAISQPSEAPWWASPATLRRATKRIKRRDSPSRGPFCPRLASQETGRGPDPGTATVGTALMRRASHKLRRHARKYGLGVWAIVTRSLQLTCRAEVRAAGPRTMTGHRNREAAVWEGSKMTRGECGVLLLHRSRNRTRDKKRKPPV